MTTATETPTIGAEQLDEWAADFGLPVAAKFGPARVYSCPSFAVGEEFREWLQVQHGIMATVNRESNTVAVSPPRPVADESPAEEEKPKPRAKRTTTRFAKRLVVQEFQSKSDPSVMHKVMDVETKAGEQLRVCTCRGFIFNRRCWHLDATE